MKYQALCLVMLASISSCKAPPPKIWGLGPGAGGKGSESFKDLMSKGAGSFRPKAILPKASLGLTNSAIHSIKIDQSSGSWATVTFDSTLSDTIEPDEDLLKVTQDFIAKYESELGFSPGEILAQSGSVQEPYAGTKLVTLQRQFNGTPVKGAFINFFFAVQADKTLRLSEIVNNSFGPIKLGSSSVATAPSKDEAIAATGVGGLEVLSQRAVIQPILNKDGVYEFGYASEYELKDGDSDEHITLTLDNTTKEIREAYSNQVAETVQINAESFSRSYVLKDTVSRPLQFAQIRDGNTNLSTDINGNVDVNNPEVTVVLTNTKNKSSVVDAKAPTVPVSFNATLTSGSTNLKMGSTDIPSMNVFVAMQETIKFAATQLSTSELSIIEKGFNATVNIAQACNAFYNGVALNFFNANTQCSNTGLISDVVHHEWGHGLDDYLGPNSRAHGARTGITDGAYSEGIGDILSAYMAKSSALAPGFFLNNTQPLRSLSNNRTEPPATAAEAEVHSAGQIIGGAFWDMHVNLSNLYGVQMGNEIATRLFLRHLMTSDRYVDAFAAVLRVDDDDNNAATRSPNYCNITSAFAKHKLSGGESVIAGCMDTDISLKVKIDLDQGNGLLGVVASAFGAAKIVACPGKAITCQAGSEGFVDLSAAADGDDVLTGKGVRKYYAGNGTINTRQSATYSFYSLDAKGQIMAKRTLDFKADAAPSIQ